MPPSFRPKEDHHLWNFLFSVFFVVVLIAALYVMYQVRGGYLVSVSWFDALMLALATFRLTRLVVYDKITRWFRVIFDFDNGFCTTVRDLLSCPWCISIWSALIVIFFYFIYPWAWTIILLLALSGVGSLIQLWANSLGWGAENLKLDAIEKEALRKEHIDRSSLGK